MNKFFLRWIAGLALVDAIGVALAFRKRLKAAPDTLGPGGRAAPILSHAGCMQYAGMST